MTDTEIILTIAVIFLVVWNMHTNWRLDIHHTCIDKLQKVVVQLQGLANRQLTINAKTEEVQSILADVNESLKKIVESQS